MGGIDFAVLVLLLYVVKYERDRWSYKRQSSMLLPGQCGWRYECCDSLRRRYSVTTLHSASDGIVNFTWRRVKVAITAPPVDGQANGHLTKFLGKRFRVAKKSDRHRKRRGFGPSETGKNYSPPADPPGNCGVNFSR